MKPGIFLSVSIFLSVLARLDATPLDDYVEKEDSSYSYELIRTATQEGYKLYVYEMISQTWRKEAEVDRTLWRHWLLVAVPDRNDHGKALLWIGSGSNGGQPPSSISSNLRDIALANHAIVAELKMVPNQPIVFTGDPDPRYRTGGRVEDELIAFSWDRYRTTLDPEWLPRLPMTKAAVRAMDTLQAEFPRLSGFMVGGASKRGWTTWTTAAVDPRVEAIAPLVIDILNVNRNMHHHFDVYGYWADALQDYVDMNIMEWLDSPTFFRMMDIVDPYSYRQRLTMPKFIVNSAGDQFFLPDSSQFYFDDLVGEKYLRYVPNTDHRLNQEALDNLSTYYYSFLNDTPRPEFSWTKESDGTLTVRTVTRPSKVLLWKASNPTERNFRLDTIGAAWKSSILRDWDGDGVFVASVPEPDRGWTAFFVELTFSTPGPGSFKFTTEVSVVPENVLVDPTPTSTPTDSPTPTSTFTPTSTPTETPTPSDTPTPTPTNTPRIETDFSYLPIGDGPVFVAAGDLNGDGRDDLVSANYESDRLAILLNRGDGTFPDTPDFLVLDEGSHPSFVTIGDLDNDLDNDLLATGVQDNTILAFLNEGDGSFDPVPHTLAVPADRPISLFVGDLNADSFFDLAVVNSRTNDLSIVLNPGTAQGLLDPNLPIERIPTQGGLPTYLQAGLLDSGNLLLDLVVPNFADATVSVFLGTGHGRFAPVRTYSTGVNPRNVALLDIDGDGYRDICVAAEGAPQLYPPIPGSVVLHFNDGLGGFGETAVLETGNRPATVIPLDFDGDGDLDLGVVHQGISEEFADPPVPGNLTVYYNDGGVFRNFDRFEEIGDRPLHAAVASLNDTLRDDLVVPNQEGDNLGILEVTRPLGPSRIADLNADRQLTAEDLFLFSATFAQRDPRLRELGDLDRNDRLTPMDILVLLESYRQGAAKSGTIGGNRVGTTP